MAFKRTRPADKRVLPLLSLFLNDRFGIDEETIGYLFMYIGSMSVFARVLVLGRMVDRFGEVRVSRIGICCLGMALILLPLAISIRLFSRQDL